MDFYQYLTPAAILISSGITWGLLVGRVRAIDRRLNGHTEHIEKLWISIGKTREAVAQQAGKCDANH